MTGGAMVRLGLALIMLSTGVLLKFALDSPVEGTVWIVGAVLMANMPRERA